MAIPTSGGVGDVAAALKSAIVAALPGAEVEVGFGSPGHYELSVRCADFAGKTMLQQQRLVYAAIAALMQGDSAPVHAIDRLRTSAGA